MRHASGIHYTGNRIKDDRHDAIVMAVSVALLIAAVGLAFYLPALGMSW